MRNKEVFDISSVGYVKRIVIGNNNPEKATDERTIQKQIDLLNRCLTEYPKGKIIGIERNFFILNIGEHQVVMQYSVYHLGFKRKPNYL
ncbi:hypothetical protein [Megamonas sp.]|jgi:hypothetical protein|uniref:hypothetical protein n=1 Tax=Megamonas sp. TaxID=2049033 RepID=UPI002586928C|nr:hypothetical protein [Megamonas sp.]